MGTADGNVIGTTQIVNHGPAARRFNLVILGDGYQQAQLAQYHNDAQNFVNVLFATAPFDTIQNAFNVFRVDVTSTDSGADDPTACGGTGAIANTYFDAAFCHSGVRRALTVNNLTVIDVANAQVPAWHMLIVIVNSTVYGGTGGQVACFSLAAGANEIALHEMGHTAFGLADEYEYYQGCGVDVNHDRYTGGEPTQPNVTTNANRNTIKWRDLVAATTAMPTTTNAHCANCDPQPNPVAAATVGAFEGAYYYHCGAYRPQFNCRMRALFNPYCAVCERTIRETLAPYVDRPVEVIQPWSNNGRLGLLVYGWSAGSLDTVFGSSDMGQGAGALSWLAGDINADGHRELIQPWNDNGRLGMLVYGWNGSAMTTLWGTSDIGQGSGALAWLVGDVQGHGHSVVLQPWNNGGRLGLIVYGWNGSAMTTLWGTGDMSQSSGALAWLIGDVQGHGHSVVLQPWNNGGRLGLIVYGWNGSAMTTLWGTGDMGQGSGALAWLIGDVNGDGRAEVIQPWNNNGRLGMLVYGWNGSAMTTLWGTGDMGQGSGALAWLVGDVNGDGRDELVQLWNDKGRLGLIVYGWNGSAMTTLWGTGDMGQGSGALAWLIGDVNGDGRAEVIQPWNNNGRLGLIVYGWNGGGMATLWETANIGQGSGALRWLAADII